MPVTAPENEIGYTLAPTYSRVPFDDGETTPELVWPQSIYVYDAMRRTDAQVGSVLRAVTETLLRTPWRIDPAGAKARVTKFVADDLGLPIVGKNPTPPPRLKDRFSWPSHLREALLMLPMGHAYFEQVYRITDDGKAAHLRKLAYRPAKTIEQISVASDGGLISIKQYWTATDRRPEPIPVDHLVAYIHAKEGGNWLGTSILRNCYKNWLLKDRLLRVQAQTIERNGMGIPLYTAAETETDLTKGLGMATSWRAGEAAGSAVPYGATLRLVGVEGTLPDAMPVIEYHDAQIARAVLAHFLNLGQQTGSWALGTTFADFFTMSLQTLAEQIRDTATQHIVEDLVDINFGENEPAPRLVFDEIGSRQAATAQALKTLIDAGVIHPDEVLEETSRQQYGLPPADPATATLPPGATGATPPAPTQMGDTSPSVAAKSAPKGRAASAADDDGLFPMPKRQAPARRKGKRVQARYNPAQKRDPDGEWGDGISGPGLPGLDMEGFDLIDEAEGSFGTVRMGVDDTGDVRLAFHEGNDARAIDLAGDEFGDLTDAVRRLQGSRSTELPDDAESDGVYDDDRFGPDREHKVELLGNGIISIVFGADDPDPWTLNLDPPDGGDDDAGAFLRAADEVDNELGNRVTAAAGVDTHPGGEELKHYWVYGEGAAKWSTWTELYNHLKTGKGISSGFAKRIAAAWFHLRYGYWPGDHRNVHAKYNPSQVRDPNGEWGDGVPGVSAVVGRVKSEDGLDLELSAAGAGVGIHFPFPDDAQRHFDTVTLSPASTARLKTDLDELDASRKTYMAKVRSAIRRFDAADEGTPEYTAAQDAFFEIAGDGQIIGSGSVPGVDGGALHWALAMGDEEPTLWVALSPPDADPDWDLHNEASDGAGGFFPVSAVAKLRKELNKADVGRTVAAASPINDETTEWEEAIDALIAALAELSGSVLAAFVPGDHPRNPKGAGGGRFRSNVDRLKDALKAHKAGTGTGDPFEAFDREQLRRVAKARGIELKRGEDRDSIADKLKAHLDDGAATPAEPKKPDTPAPAKRAPTKRAPTKKTPAKRTPAKKATAGVRRSGKDLIGSDPEALARRVAKDREHHVAADRSLAAIGHEQGFDGKPRVVSKAEMDRLVADGNTEVFRGVKALSDGKTAAEIHEDLRNGHAWYGLGIYGNGYYWGGPDHAAKFADKTPGSTARAVLDPNAKIIEFWGDLYPEHEKFMEQHKDAPDGTHITEVFSDPGRYAAALGYDVIKIVPNKGEPWYNVLNRTALIVEEA